MNHSSASKAALSHQDLASSSPAEVRKAIAGGLYQSHTAGLAAGYLQTNIVILPAESALDFARFCNRNSKPCPLVGVSETGDPMLPTLGQNINILTDVPEYNVYRDGKLVESPTSIEDLWRDDLVTFALGCSFTFERAVVEAGISLRHIDEDKTVPMYRSNIQTYQAGPFKGPYAVSMRAIREEDLDQVVAISKRYPLAHGGPVHIGDPAAIGITDLDQPNWGDATAVKAGEVPVFWACGVTPQIALVDAGLPLCITHKPGRMLITDVSEMAETPLYQPS